MSAMSVPQAQAAAAARSGSGQAPTPSNPGSSSQGAAAAIMQGSWGDDYDDDDDDDGDSTPYPQAQAAAAARSGSGQAPTPSNPGSSSQGAAAAIMQGSWGDDYDDDDDDDDGGVDVVAAAWDAQGQAASMRIDSPWHAEGYAVDTYTSEPSSASDSDSDFSDADLSDRLGSVWQPLSEAEAMQLLTHGSESELLSTLHEARVALVGLSPVTAFWAACIKRYTTAAKATAARVSHHLSSYLSDLDAESFIPSSHSRGVRQPTLEETVTALGLLFDQDVQGYIRSGGQRIVGGGGDDVVGWELPPLQVRSLDDIEDCVCDVVPGFPAASISQMLLIVEHMSKHLHTLDSSVQDLCVVTAEVTDADPDQQKDPLLYKRLGDAILAVSTSGPLVSLEGCLSLPDSDPWSCAVRACCGWESAATFLGSPHLVGLPIGVLLRALSLVCTSPSAHFDLHGVRVCAEAYTLRMQAEGPVAAFWIGKPGTCKTTTARHIMPSLFTPWQHVPSPLAPAKPGDNSVVQLRGGCTLQLSCSDKVTALPNEFRGLDARVQVASAAVQVVLSPWTSGPVMGHEGRALPLSVFVFDEGGRVLTANALSAKREARSVVRTQGKLQHGPLFDYLSTAREWGGESYSLRQGRSDRVAVIFTGNSDKQGDVETALKSVEPERATAAVMAVVDKSLAGSTEAFLMDRLLHGLRTQLVELDAAKLLRSLAVPKLLHYVSGAAADWGRSRRVAFKQGFASKVAAAAKSINVPVAPGTVEQVAARTIIIDLSTVVANFDVPEAATGRSLAAAMPGILGFATQPVLDKALLRWAVQDNVRSQPFGAALDGVFAVLKPGSEQAQFVYASTRQLLPAVQQGGLLLQSLHCKSHLGDVVPAPAAPHLILIERAVADARGAMQRVQCEVAGLRLGGNRLGRSNIRPSAAVHHTLAFSNAAASMYRQLQQGRQPSSPPCSGLAFHVPPGDPHQLLVVQCPEQASLISTSGMEQMYGGEIASEIALCNKHHRCIVSGGNGKPTMLHPAEVAFTSLELPEGVLSRLAAMVIHSAYLSGLLLPGHPVHQPFSLGAAGGKSGAHHATLAAAAPIPRDFWEPVRFNRAIAGGDALAKAALLDLLLLITPVGKSATHMLVQFWTQRQSERTRALKRSVLSGIQERMQKSLTLAKAGQDGRPSISPPSNGCGTGLFDGKLPTLHRADLKLAPGRLRLSSPLKALKADSISAADVGLLAQVQGSEPIVPSIVRAAHSVVLDTAVPSRKVRPYGSFGGAHVVDPWRLDLSVYTQGRNRVVLWMSAALAKAADAPQWDAAATILDVESLRLYQAMSTAAAGDANEWVVFFDMMLKQADSNGALQSVEIAGGVSAANAVLSYLPAPEAFLPLQGMPADELLFEQQEATFAVVAAVKTWTRLPEWHVSAKFTLEK